jgi:hypothetical protein
MDILFSSNNPALASAFSPRVLHAMPPRKGADGTTSPAPSRPGLVHCGLVAWPRLFQNLRTSRQTELAAQFPIRVVCQWIGNSAAIAQKHYLQVTEADFARAAQASDKKAARIRTQQPVASFREDTQEMQKPRRNPGFSQESTGNADGSGYPQGESNPCLSLERAMS